LGHNKFSDWSDEEYSQLLGYHEPSDHKEKRLRQSRDVQPEPMELYKELRNDIDWRTVGAVNPVKDQGMCGSCWAFATASTLESGHFLHSGVLYNLSEQQFVDCAGGDYGN
jgi:cathepsin F